jgi:hypothetical protein
MTPADATTGAAPVVGKEAIGAIAGVVDRERDGAAGQARDAQPDDTGAAGRRSPPLERALGVLRPRLKACGVPDRTHLVIQLSIDPGGRVTRAHAGAPGGALPPAAAACVHGTLGGVRLRGERGTTLTAELDL